MCFRLKQYWKKQQYDYFDRPRPFYGLMLLLQGSVRFVSLKYQDGTAYDEHAGGVAVHDGFVYLPGKMGVDVFRLADILAGDASTIGKIPAEYDTDCVTFHDGYLLVGDFYHPGAYETPPGHHIITPAGDENKAVIAVYKADSAAQFGIDPQPVAAISVRDRVQGIGITEEGEIVLSGRSDRQIKLHGLRVEPQEIISCIASYPGVSSVAVRMLDVAGQSVIAVYYTADMTAAIPRRTPNTPNTM